MYLYARISVWSSVICFVCRAATDNIDAKPTTDHHADKNMLCAINGRVYAADWSNNLATTKKRMLPKIYATRIKRPLLASVKRRIDASAGHHYNR